MNNIIRFVLGAIATMLCAASPMYAMQRNAPGRTTLRSFTITNKITVLDGIPGKYRTVGYVSMPELDGVVDGCRVAVYVSLLSAAPFQADKADKIEGLDLSGHSADDRNVRFLKMMKEIDPDNLDNELGHGIHCWRIMEIGRDQEMEKRISIHPLAPRYFWIKPAAFWGVFSRSPYYEREDNSSSYFYPDKNFDENLDAFAWQPNGLMLYRPPRQMRRGSFNHGQREPSPGDEGEEEGEARPPRSSASPSTQPVDLRDTAARSRNRNRSRRRRRGRSRPVTHKINSPACSGCGTCDPFKHVPVAPDRTSRLFPAGTFVHFAQPILGMYEKDFWNTLNFEERRDRLHDLEPHAEVSFEKGLVPLFELEEPPDVSAGTRNRPSQAKILPYSIQKIMRGLISLAREGIDSEDPVAKEFLQVVPYDELVCKLGGDSGQDLSVKVMIGSPGTVDASEGGIALPNVLVEDTQEHAAGGETLRTCLTGQYFMVANMVKESIKNPANSMSCLANSLRPYFPIEDGRIIGIFYPFGGAIGLADLIRQESRTVFWHDNKIRYAAKAHDRNTFPRLFPIEEGPAVHVDSVASLYALNLNKTKLQATEFLGRKVRPATYDPDDTNIHNRIIPAFCECQFAATIKTMIERGIRIFIVMLPGTGAFEHETMPINLTRNMQSLASFASLLSAQGIHVFFAEPTTKNRAKLDPHVVTLNETLSAARLMS